MQKSQLAIYSLLLISSIVLFNFTSVPQSQSPQKQTFMKWKQEFKKNYPSDFQQNYRFNLFLQNYHMVNQHNAKYQSGQELSFLRLNSLSDLTAEEISNTYFSIPNQQIKSNFACSGNQYPKKTSFDANFTLDSKIVSPTVYDQLNSTCASGYAFATAAAVESLMYKIFNNLIPLSAQQLVDCTKQTQNNGCSGGNSLNTLHYLMNRGAMRNSQYPYVGKTGDCRYTAAKKIFELQNCVKVDQDLTMLKSQIFNQPVIVGFDSSDPKFGQFGGGLYEPPNKCGDKISHYMLAVGWGEVTQGTFLNKKTYYYIIVKNSLGMKWGENGFGKIVMQVDKGATNGCGMLKDMYFPYG